MRSALLLLLALGLSAETVTENHPDGTRSVSFAVDKTGKRDGAFTAWWPGGKLLQEKAVYDNGELHGLRLLYDEKGRLQTEQTWLRGRLIYPRSQAQTEEGLTRLEAEARQWVAGWPKPGNPGAAPPEEQAKALARLRQYRWLCGLSHDVILDERYTDEAQEAAELLLALGKLDHSPAKPAGWNDADYAKGKRACGHGNLAMGGGSLIQAVDMWMNDSDASNIGVLGHRRWMLNPVMLACGYGIAGRYQVIWAHDAARKDPLRQSWQAFPPPGFMPVTHFSARHAWHISLNPADYKVDLKSETFVIYPLDQRLQRSGAALVLDHDGSDGTGYGSYANARIVRPDGAGAAKGQPAYVIAKGRSYEAVVGGLQPKGDAAKELSWVVTFY